MSFFSYICKPHRCLLFQKGLFMFFAYFLMRLSVFLVHFFKFLVHSGCQSFVRWVDCKIFSHSVGCQFTLIMVYFAVQKLFSLSRSHLSILAFVAIAFGVFVMSSLPMPMSWMVLPRFYSRVFMVFGLMLKSLMDLELIFV